MIEFTFFPTPAKVQVQVFSSSRYTRVVVWNVIIPLPVSIPSLVAYIRSDHTTDLGVQPWFKSE